jgi:2-polyprenyl-6-hydroxyphenyl methylase/3-demethylubiquinone-9 3-methyltransferase
VFSTSFDHFSIEDWAKYIYNEGYILVDGEYDGTRARQFAKSIHGMFGAQPSLRVIDYGGGNGSFADELRRLGWGNKQSGGHVETYDPFVAEFSRAPEIKADLLVSCEVLEHTSDPEKTWSEIASVCHEETVMVMTTLLAPPNPDPNLLDWWYIGPRNGHMTIFTQLGLATIARRHGFSMGSFSPGLHGFWRRVPSWAKSVFRV